MLARVWRKSILLVRATSDNEDYVAVCTSAWLVISKPGRHERTTTSSAIGRFGIAFLEIVEKAANLLHSLSVYFGVGSLQPRFELAERFGP
jgi:hypothetical protein